MAWIDPTTPVGVQPVGFTSGFTLVFSDEFNSSTLDATKWRNYHDFADKSASSAWDINAGGNSALRMWWNGNTSTDNQMMVSNGTDPFRKRFGYYEARMKCASGKGWFPGFWLYPVSNTGGENADGSQQEIDIVEWFAYENGDWLVDTTNYRAKNSKFTIWTEGGGGATNQGGAIKQSDVTGYDTNISTAYHVHGLHWTATGGLKWYIDGALIGTVADPWGASNTMQLCIILQLWWGPNGGIPVPASGATPTTASDTTSMLFDYVRVWDIGTAPPTGPTWKIMPLGDSITEGQSATANYRDRLADLLTANSISSGFYGSMATNTSALPSGFQKHEGHSSWCSTDAGSVDGLHYYVNPASGNDANAGTTSAAPWRTIRKAADTVTAPGSTIWLMDGTYTQGEVPFFNSGTQAKPITLRAVNKWQAIISSTSGQSPAISVYASWITIRDLYFQLSPSNVPPAQYTSANCDIRAWNSVNATVSNPTTGRVGFHVIGCKSVTTTPGRAACIKSGHDYSIIEDCDVYSTLETFNCRDSIIRNNIVRGQDQFGISILVKGGARDNLVYGNLVYNTSESTDSVGIALGGESQSIYLFDQTTNREAYNCYAFNNIVVNNASHDRLQMAFWGAQNCGFINNVGIRTKFDCRPTVTNGGTTVSPTILNNIFYGAGTSYFYGSFTYQGTLTRDYNNFYNYSNAPTQAHPITGNPLFVNLASDWHLQAASPCISAGTSPISLPKYHGGTVDILTDFDGATRSAPWSIGAYEYGATPPTDPVDLSGAVCQFGSAAFNASRPIGVLENIDAWLVANPVDIVLLLIGINDGSNTYVQEAISQIIDKILAADSSTKILVSTLRTGGNAQTNRNAAITAACAGKTGVTVVNAYAGWVDATDFTADNLHPSTTGYQKMADNWFAAIQTAIAPGAVFNAAVSQAPANGATIEGFVTLEVVGDLLENVELLPPTGYLPLYGSFIINPAKTVATLVFDTTAFPNGTFSARISAYNQPAGSPNPTTEIVAMTTRTWTINNLPAAVMPVCTIFDIG